MKVQSYHPRRRGVKAALLGRDRTMTFAETSVVAEHHAYDASLVVLHEQSLALGCISNRTRPTDAALIDGGFS